MIEDGKDNIQNKIDNNNIISNSNNNNINIINENNKSPSYNSHSNSKKSSNKDYSNLFSSHSSKSRSKSKSKSYSHSKSKSYSSSSYSHSYSRERRKKVGIPQIFVTKLSSRVTKKDLDREFSKFGEIRNLKIKRGYAFIEYYNKDDAKYAIKELDNKKLFGQQQRIVVEEAKGSKREREREREKERRRDRDRYRKRDYRSRSRSRDRDRDYYYRRKSNGPKKTDKCFNCGKEGHWANECTLPRKEK